MRKKADNVITCTYKLRFNLQTADQVIGEEKPY